MVGREVGTYSWKVVRILGDTLSLGGKDGRTLVQLLDNNKLDTSSDKVVHKTQDKLNEIKEN